MILQLESCAPYNSRAPSRQVIEFSHFDDSTFPVEGVSAHFTVATRDPQYVPLDDDEMFANNLLGFVQIPSQAFELRQVGQLTPTFDTQCDS